jgi:hypothetical protein
MYAPKLRQMTSDERWMLGLEYRLDEQAKEFIAEIHEMAEKAKAEFPIAPTVTSVPWDDTMTTMQKLYMAGLNGALGPSLQQQALAAQHNPYAAYVHGGLQHALFGTGGIMPW